MEELNAMIKETWDQPGEISLGTLEKQSLWESIDQATDSNGQPRQRLRRTLPFAMAALMVLVLGLSSYFFFFVPKVHQITNQESNPMHVALADGSSVWLNRGAEITYEEDFGKTHRSLILTGEAFFDVSHNKELPFIVDHGDLSTRVHGTSFNIRKSKENLPVVTLFEGKVQVYDSEDSWFIQPGEELTYQEHKAFVQTFDLANHHVLAWKNQRYEFKNSSLSEVIDVLLEHHNTSLSYDEKLLAGKRITCEVGFNENLKNALDIILYPHNLKAHYMNGKLVIMKNKKTDKVPPK